MSNDLTAVKSLFDSWLTPKLLAQVEPAFSEPALRSYIFNAEYRQSTKGTIPGNGLAPHIRRVGSKVLINHGGFLSWIDGSAKKRCEPPDRKTEGQKDAPLARAAGVVLPDADGLPISKQRGRRRL